LRISALGAGRRNRTLAEQSRKATLVVHASKPRFGAPWRTFWSATHWSMRTRRTRRGQPDRGSGVDSATTGLESLQAPNASSRSKRPSGGLGLACRSFRRSSAAHGGVLIVTSTPGRGTANGQPSLSRASLANAGKAHIPAWARSPRRSWVDVTQHPLAASMILLND